MTKKEVIIALIHNDLYVVLRDTISNLQSANESLTAKVSTLEQQLQSYRTGTVMVMVTICLILENESLRIQSQSQPVPQNTEDLSKAIGEYVRGDDGSSKY